MVIILLALVDVKKKKTWPNIAVSFLCLSILFWDALDRGNLPMSLLCVTVMMHLFFTSNQYLLHIVNA